MKRKLVITIVGLAGGFPATSTFGEPITFVFSGELTLVSDVDGVLNGEVEVGARFGGTYTFESTTPDTRPDDPEDGLYEKAITDITGHLFGSAGPLLFSGPPDELPEGLANFIRVGDNVGGFEADYYLAYSVIALLDIPVSFTLEVSDSSATVFQDDLLLLEPPSLELFDQSEFQLITEDDRLFLLGEIDEFRLVPEPATAWLLGLAAAAASRFRARRQRCTPRKARATMVQENPS